MVVRNHLQLQALRFSPDAGPWRGQEVDSSSDELSIVKGYVGSDGDDDSIAAIGPETFLGVLIHRQQEARARASNNPSINASRNNGGDCESESESDDQEAQETGRRNTLNAPSNRNDRVQDTSLDDDSPPTPWRYSNAKQRIIDELKDETSDIYLSIGHFTPSNFANVNFQQIRLKYAGNKYKPNLFRDNMKRLLNHLQKKTGPFEPEKNVIEPWYTSKNNVSEAYALLFLLYMDSEKSGNIGSMTGEQAWRSHPKFQQYDLEKFKQYNKNMKKLTRERKHRIKNEEASYHRDMLKIPRKQHTSRGYPFWNSHPASEMLKNDEISGVAIAMKPQQLWKSRKEYQAFPLVVFRKHIYQERTKQLAAPYWQHKRNKNAMKKREDALKMMKEWNQNQLNHNVEGLMGDWERMNIRGS